MRRYEQGLVDSAEFLDPFEVEHAGACDFGLPDTDICDGLVTPPAELSVFQEAWSRGCATALPGCNQGVVCLSVET